MKKSVIVGVALATVVAGTVLFLHSNLDSIVKRAIEKYGSAAAQTDVRLDSVHLALGAGEGAITGLKVANPKGYSSAQALQLGVISVKLDTGSISGNGPIVIRELLIDHPEVDYESTTTGETNLQA